MRFGFVRRKTWGPPKRTFAAQSRTPKVRQRRGKLVRHQIEVLEDTRTEKSLIQNGLAAPSQDLELTLEWLDREGVKSALPAINGWRNTAKRKKRDYCYPVIRRPGAEYWFQVQPSG